MAKFLISWTVDLVVEAENADAAKAKADEWTIFDVLDRGAAVGSPSEPWETTGSEGC